MFQFALILILGTTYAQEECRDGHCASTADFKYKDLCDTLEENKRTRDAIVILQWTRPMLDMFHRGGLECVDEDSSLCDLDDDFSATFRRTCKNGGVPCFPKVDRPQRKDVGVPSNGEGFMWRGKCRDWGLDCLVRQSSAEILFPETLLDADVVLFEGTNNRVWGSGVYPPYKCQGQLWIMDEFRPSSVYPFLRDPDYVGMFDATVGYSRNWTVWTPDYVVDPNTFFSRRSTGAKSGAPVMVMISQCNTPNNRIAYVEELMKHIDVDSYGKCLRNAEWPNDAKEIRHKYRQKEVVMNQYPFYLAFENSNEPDYVSEKIYNALAQGVVPVYMGAPNIAMYAPTRSYIDVNDFATPADLAAYLQHLLRHPDEYEAYLAWKTGTPEPHMEVLEKNSRKNYMCRICEHAAHVKAAQKEAFSKTEL